MAFAIAAAATPAARAAAVRMASAPASNPACSESKKRACESSSPSRPLLSTKATRAAWRARLSSTWAASKAACALELALAPAPESPSASVMLVCSAEMSANGPLAPQCLGSASSMAADSTTKGESLPRASSRPTPRRRALAARAADENVGVPVGPHSSNAARRARSAAALRPELVAGAEYPGDGTSPRAGLALTPAPVSMSTSAAGAPACISSAIDIPTSASPLVCSPGAVSGLNATRHTPEMSEIASQCVGSSVPPPTADGAPAPGDAASRRPDARCACRTRSTSWWPLPESTTLDAGDISKTEPRGAAPIAKLSGGRVAPTHP
mmetsp:Transcript_13329/g.55834  ORF Transcript_13329/g.55834 Transcript_13329/m.55834 type:complete len:325 (+) Transcript_13329:677-1651(+)